MTYSGLKTRPLTGILCAALIAALGACSFADERIEPKYLLTASAPDHWVKFNDTIKIKSEPLTKPPTSFMSEALPCLSKLGSFVGAKTDISLAPEGSLIFQVKIRNDSPHVVKLLPSEIALFDPNGNRFSALDREKMKLYFMANRACDDSPKLDLQFANLELVDGKLKILPGRANTGYVVFKPDDLKFSGAWSLSFFDMSAFSVKPPESVDPQTITYQFTLNKIEGNAAGDAALPASANKDKAREDDALKAAGEKIAAEKAAADKLAAEKATAEKAAEKAAAEKLAALKAAAEKAVAEAEQAAAEQAAAEKSAAEKFAAEKETAGKLAALQAAVAKAAAEKLAAENAEKAASAKAATLKAAAAEAIAAAKTGAQPNAGAENKTESTAEPKIEPKLDTKLDPKSENKNAASASLKTKGKNAAKEQIKTAKVAASVKK